MDQNTYPTQDSVCVSHVYEKFMYRKQAYNSLYGEWAPRITGSLSALASILIIYIIFKSPMKLSTIYHRLMFCMSLADICASIATALTHLLMPAVGVDQYFDLWFFTGPRIGNKQTCTAQGFVIFVGTVCATLYKAALCVYYAFSITLQKEDKWIRRRVEPIIHLICVASSIGIASWTLALDFYNPSISLPYCFVDNTSKLQLELGNLKENAGDYRQIGNLSIILNVTKALLAMVLLASFASLLSVCWKVLALNRDQKQSEKLLHRLHKTEEGNSYDTLRTKLINTTAIFIQAISYIVALLLSTGIALFGLLFVKISTTMHVEFILGSTHGLFNFFIFVGHKIYYQIRNNTKEKLSIFQVLIKLLTGNYEESELHISNLNMVIEMADLGANHIDVEADDDVNFSDDRGHPVGDHVVGDNSEAQDESRGYSLSHLSSNLSNAKSRNLDDISYPSGSPSNVVSQNMDGISYPSAVSQNMDGISFQVSSVRSSSL